MQNERIYWRVGQTRILISPTIRITHWTDQTAPSPTDFFNQYLNGDASPQCRDMGDYPNDLSLPLESEQSFECGFKGLFIERPKPFVKEE